VSSHRYRYCGVAVVLIYCSCSCVPGIPPSFLLHVVVHCVLVGEHSFFGICHLNNRILCHLNNPIGDCFVLAMLHKNINQYYFDEITRIIRLSHTRDKKMTSILRLLKIIFFYKLFKLRQINLKIRRIHHCQEAVK